MPGTWASRGLYTGASPLGKNGIASCKVGFSSSIRRRRYSLHNSPPPQVRITMCVSMLPRDQSSKPKGTPIALTDCDIDPVDLPQTARGPYFFGIRVQSLTRETTFGTVTEEVRSLC
jgi:hypothetical protein